MKKNIIAVIIALGLIGICTGCKSVTFFPKTKPMEMSGMQGEKTQYINPIIVVE